MTMPRLYDLFLGFCVLVAIDKSNATNGAHGTSFDRESTASASISREHNERKLISEDTSPGEFPFFSQWGGCGATLIWEDILLTSASCNIIESESVLVGAHLSHKEQGDSVKRNIVSRHMHPGFDPESLMDNYMVLKLDEKVDTLPTVWINPKVEIPTDPELYVIGFGFTASLLHVNQIYGRTFHHTILDTSELLQSGNSDSEILQKARTTIVPHAICNAYDQYAGFIDDESMICANDDDGTCLGDNGGPLCVMMNNECLQIGIVSFGEFCSMGIRPTVYSSISAGYGWIEKMVCTHSENPPSSCQAFVKIRAPFPGSKEPFESRSESSNSSRLPNTNLPSHSYSLAPSSNPSILNSLLPSDGPSLAPSDKPSLVNSGITSDPSSVHDNSNLSDEQENRDLQRIRYKMPMVLVRVQPLNEAPVIKPDGIHLFFWPFGSRIGKLGHCEGDCNSDDDCDEGLYCFQRDSSVTSIPGCVGSDTSRTDFCVASLPGRTGSSGINQITRLPVLSFQKLGQCEGDCNSDEDCAEGLYCFVKDEQMTSVPGCSGFDNSRTDYCTIRTESRLDVSPPTPTNNNPVPTDHTATPPLLFVYPENPPPISNLPLQVCQGDCDRDSDCASGLICFKRHPDEISIPGCSGITTTRTDFCVDPTFFPPFTLAPSNTETVKPASSKPTSTPTEALRTFSPTEALRTFTPTVGTSTLETIENSNTDTATLQPPPPISVPTTLNPSISQITPAPTQSPILASTSIQTTPNPSSLDSPVSITVAIFFDPWPEEVSWKIESEEGELITSVGTGSYVSPRDQTFELVTVTPGKNYKFTIADAANDGIAGIGTLYEIVLTENTHMKLLEGDGVFENGRTQLFYVPIIEEYPTRAPVEPTTSPAPTFNTVNVYLVIIFDNWHQETSWEITDASDPNLPLAEAAYDTYRAGESITNEIPLPPGRDYIFTIRDFFDDGIKDGEYLLMSGDGNILLEGNGDFGASRNHTFTLP